MRGPRTLHSDKQSWSCKLRFQEISWPLPSTAQSKNSLSMQIWVVLPWWLKELFVPQEWKCTFMYTLAHVLRLMVKLWSSLSRKGSFCLSQGRQQSIGGWHFGHHFPPTIPSFVSGYKKCAYIWNMLSWLHELFIFANIFFLWDR